MTEHVLCALADLESGTARRFDIGGERIALVRIDDAVFALGDRCSHAEASLSEGDVDVERCRIECPRHGAEFSLESGAPESLPATRPVPTYAVRVTDGNVFVELS